MKHINVKQLDFAGEEQDFENAPDWSGDRVNQNWPSDQHDSARNDAPANHPSQISIDDILRNI